MVDPAGTVARLPAGGYARFPACHPEGGVAYLAITTAPGEWQVVLVVADLDLKVYDMVPDAAVFAPPVWSADGSKLIFLQGYGVEVEATVWHRSDGRTEPVAGGANLRSAAWDPSGGIVYSRGGAIHRQTTNSDEVLWEVPAAQGLLEFGSDDLYVTVDQVCVRADGTVAAVERWYRQGESPQETIISTGDRGYRRRRKGRYPQWGTGGSLLFTSDAGWPSVDREGICGQCALRAHSATWAKADSEP